MNQASIANLETIIQAAAKQLFSGYGVELERCFDPKITMDDTFAATIGFTNPFLRGALIITLNRDLIMLSLPNGVATPEVSSNVIADWSGELANQMLGRIKKKLFLTGIEIFLGTPVVFMGKDLCHFTLHPKLSASQLFVHESGNIAVEFQADFNKEFEIGESNDSTDSSLPEGDVELF